MADNEPRKTAEEQSSEDEKKDERYRINAEGAPPPSFDIRIQTVKRFLNWTILLGVVMLVAICFAPVEDYYTARGLVRPGAYRDLYAAADAITSESLVDETDVVEAGQLLMVFDLPELRGRMDSLRGQIEVLEAELELERARTKSLERLPLPKELWEMREQIAKSEAEIAFHTAQVERLEQLVAEGAVSKQEIDRARLQYDQAKIEHERLLKRFEVVNEGYTDTLMTEARAKETVIESNLRRVRRDLEVLEERWRVSSELRAPKAGRILEMNQDHQGEIVRRGEMVVYMATGETRIVEIAGDQRNFTEVRVGQRVRYRTDTYDPLREGFAEGQVFAISPMRSRVDLGDARADQARVYSIYASIDREPVPLALDSVVTAQIILRRDRLFKVLFGID